MGVHCILWKINSTCMVSTGLVAKVRFDKPVFGRSNKARACSWPIHILKGMNRATNSLPKPDTL